MRKFLAGIITIITLFAVKEGFYILSATEKEVARQRPILIVIALSIIIPLIILSLWLWRKPKSATKT